MDPEVVTPAAALHRAGVHPVARPRGLGPTTRSRSCCATSTSSTSPTTSAPTGWPRRRRQAFAGLIGGPLPDPIELARDLGPLTAERRLLVWSAHPDEQELIEAGRHRRRDPAARRRRRLGVHGLQRRRQQDRHVPRPAGPATTSTHRSGHRRHVRAPSRSSSTNAAPAEGYAALRHRQPQRSAGRHELAVAVDLQPARPRPPHGRRRARSASRPAPRRAGTSTASASTSRRRRRRRSRRRCRAPSPTRAPKSSRGSSRWSATSRSCERVRRDSRETAALSRRQQARRRATPPLPELSTTWRAAATRGISRTPMVVVNGATGSAAGPPSAAAGRRTCRRCRRQSAKPAWRAAIVLLTNGDSGLLLGHHDVGVDERVGADEALDRRRGERGRGAATSAAHSASRRGRSAANDIGRCSPTSMPNVAAMTGHTVSQQNTSPFVRLNVPPAAAGDVAAQRSARGDEVGVDGLAQGAAGLGAGEVQRLAGGSLQRGVGGDRRQRVHVDVARWRRRRRSGGRSSAPSRRPPGGPAARPPAASRSSGARPAAPARAAAAAPGRVRSRVGARRTPSCPAAARRAAANRGRGHRAGCAASPRCARSARPRTSPAAAPAPPGARRRRGG